MRTCRDRWWSETSSFKTHVFIQAGAKQDQVGVSVHSPHHRQAGSQHDLKRLCANYPAVRAHHTRASLAVAPLRRPPRTK
eukprot:1310137-Prymnesium_polylepis.2